MEQDSENKFWVRYDIEGNVAVLYKLSFPGCFFQRWDTNKWVDASDRYLRITRDAACDEVSAEFAQQALINLTEHQLINESYESDIAGYQDSFKDHITATEPSLEIETESITDGFSALTTSAIAMHEVFLGLMSAGFTEDQALKLITGMIRSE